MTVVDLYTLQIICDEPHTGAAWKALLADRHMAETEENLTDLLPDGFRARIRRWDHEDPDEGNDDE